MDLVGANRLFFCCFLLRIKKTLPEALWPLMPLDPSPVYPYLDDGVDIPSGLRRVAGKDIGKS